MSQEFDINVLDLVKQKGFYPYEYMSDFQKFKDISPSKEKFYCSFTGKKILTNNMNMFLMKAMKDYHDLYLKCDVLLLTDVFEKIRNNNLEIYGLFPSHYLSGPGLSWNAMLNITKVEIKLIPDPDTYMLFGKGTRGGISYISNR